MDAHTKTLLERAADDEAVLHLVGAPEVPFGQHVQAAVEKLFKALINEHGRPYPRRHDLTALASQLAGLGEQLPAVPVALGDLTDYAMDFRYDDSSQMLPLDRPACIETVRLIRTYVVARIDALNAGSP